MEGVKSKEMVCIFHILGLLKCIAQSNIHTTLIQPRILIAAQAFILLGRGKKKPPRRSNSLQICSYISLHCLNPALMQTTWLRHGSYTGTLSYCTGQEQSDIQGFLPALSTLLTIKHVKKLTLSRFQSRWLLQRHEHNVTFQPALTAVPSLSSTPYSLLGVVKMPQTCGKRFPTHLCASKPFITKSFTHSIISLQCRHKYIFPQLQKDDWL